MRWRDFGPVEILWTFHTDTVRNLAANHPTLIRKYLTQVKDFATLTAWDRQRSSDSGGD